MASLFDAVDRPRVIINTNDIPSEDGNNVVFNKRLPLVDAIEKQPEITVAPEVKPSVADPEPSKVQAILDKLFGLHDQERYQLWPEKLVRDAVAAPHDTMTGQIPQYEIDPVSGEVHTSSGMIKAAQDVSALAGTGGLAGAGSETGIALGSGPLKQVLIANTNKPFYSAVENAVLVAKQPKADAQQWLSFLKNQPGVKQEEIAHLGLDKLSGAITKDELLKAVQEGQPQIKEVIKGADNGLFGNDAYDAANSYRQELFDKYGNGIRNKASREELNKLDDLEARGEMKNPNPTKYHSYQLPGGENYREMLLTLPDNRFQLKKLGSGRYAIRDTENNQFIRDASGAGKSFANISEAKTEIDHLHNINESKNYYKSSHWDEPNVLAHIRMNDRMVDGKKTLHLEEIQSDWMQEGRKKGFRGDREKRMADLVQQRDAIKEQQTAVLQKHGVTVPTGEARNEWLELADKLSPIQTEINMISRGEVGVPDAPFKKTWDELALKKAIVHAVKNGYDQISWTPGEAQAARYDLSKQVDKIAIPMVNENGTRSVRIDAKDKSPFKLMVNKDGIVEGHGGSSLQFSGKPLSDVVGKEMADKIMKLEKPDEFSGDGLKVGGQGMKAFYDKMLVDKMNALTRKYGGKVEQSDLNNELIDAGKKLKEFESQFGSKPIPADKKAEWNKLRDNVAKTKGVEPNPVHVLKITPELREHVLKKGFPLFSAGVPVFSPVDGNPFEKDKQ